MLTEALKYLTTPCPAHLRSMGYLSELIATDARYRRCRTAWQPHLDNTKSVITDAIATSRRHKKVVVLGAGILADIPIDVLCDTFETVQLVDVCFLRATRRRLRHHANIDWTVCDVTGVAGPLHAWAMGGGHADPLPVPTRPGDITLDDADLVVSANLLSQLPLIPLAFVRKRGSRVDDATAFAFGQAIVKSHLGFLQTCPGTVCLISEIERRLYDGARVLESEDPLWGVSLHREGKEWFWDMAPKPEVSPDYDIRNLVKGSYWPL